MLKFMIDKYGIPALYVEAETLDRWTAFMYACSNGFLNTIDFLVSEA